MDYDSVNPEYILEMESLSLLDYAKITLGTRQQPRAPNFYHTGYNYKYLAPAETDTCSSIPLPECDTTPGCSTYNNIPKTPVCVTSSRIHDVKNNGEVWKSIPGDLNVLQSSFFVVDTGSIDSDTLNLHFPHAQSGPINILLYYKLFLSKKTHVLHCVFSSGVVFEEDLVPFLSPIVPKVVAIIAEAISQTSAEHVCVSGHSMGAIQTVLLAYLWETSQIHMDVFSKTTFIAFGPYRGLPTEWSHPQVRAYFTCDTTLGMIDPFALRGVNIQCMNSFGLDVTGIKRIENRENDGYTMYIDAIQLKAGPQLYHNLKLYIEFGKKLFRVFKKMKKKRGTRKKRFQTRKSRILRK